MKREENIYNGLGKILQPERLLSSHPLSLLKKKLIMPLNILLDKVIDMTGLNGTGSGFFSESSKEKEAEGDGFSFG